MNIKFEGNIIKTNDKYVLTDKNELLVTVINLEKRAENIEHLTKWMLNDCTIYLPNNIGEDIVNVIPKSSEDLGFDFNNIDAYLVGGDDQFCTFYIRIYSNGFGSNQLTSNVIRVDDGYHIVCNYFDTKKILYVSDKLYSYLNEFFANGFGIDTSVLFGNMEMTLYSYDNIYATFNIPIKHDIVNAKELMMRGKIIDNADGLVHSLRKFLRNKKC